MHVGGHLREAFGEWIDNDQPDRVPAEGASYVFYDGKERDARWLLGQLAHCSDIMPGALCEDVGEERGSTYGWVARSLLRQLENGEEDTMQDENRIDGTQDKTPKAEPITVQLLSVDIDQRDGTASGYYTDPAGTLRSVDLWPGEAEAVRRMLENGADSVGYLVDTL